MSVLNFTEARIRGLAFGSGIWRDEQVKGLLVVCHRKVKTYAVQGDVRRNGRHIRTVRVKIDRVDRIGLREARNRAKALMSQIQGGTDPTVQEEETGITLKQVLEEHLSEREFSPATVENYRYAVDRYLVRFRGRAVSDITRAEVRKLFNELKAKHGKTSSSGAMRVLRALINTAMRIDETIKANPCNALRIPTSPPRQVEMLDLTAWWAETEKLYPNRRDLHRTMLLTGARRRSLLNIKRSDVDLERGIILLRHMKVGGPMLLPIGVRLTDMLRARMEEDVPLNSVWLWPSATSSCGHIVEPKDVRKATLPSPHEYRHLARTLLIAAGVPYAESALLLGHKLPGATGGYVHPEHLVEHLQPHMQSLEDRIFAARPMPIASSQLLEIDHAA